MSRLSVSIKGMDNIKKSFLVFNNETVKKMVDVGVTSLLDIQTTAKSPGYVPYKTGTLKGSITSQIDLKRSGEKITIGSVGSNVKYARIQEYGGTAGRGSKILGKLYLTRAINDNLSKIRQRIMALRIIGK